MLVKLKLKHFSMMMEAGKSALSSLDASVIFEIYAETNTSGAWMKKNFYDNTLSCASENV